MLIIFNPLRFFCRPPRVDTLRPPPLHPPIRLRRYNVLVKYRREVPSAVEACSPWLQHADNNREYEEQQRNLTATHLGNTTTV